MKTFTKILVGGMLLFALSVQAATFATNTLAGGTYLLLTNRCVAYSFELTSAYNADVKFFDCNSLTAPYYGTNYVNAAWTNTTSYASNYVTSYIGENGYTNSYTNAGRWYISSAHAAATNALPAMDAVVVTANTYNTRLSDITFTKGVVMVANTNVSLIINYR